MRYLGSLVLFIFILLANGCLEPYAPPAIQTDYKYLVVDGFLNAANEPTVINLSRTQTLSDSDTPAEPVVNALVQIEDEQGSYQRLTGTGDGTYSSSNLNLDLKKKYRLRINTRDTKLYVSDFVEIKQSPPIDSVSWREEDGGVQFYLNTHDPANNTWYYRWTIEETWEYSSKFLSRFEYKDFKIQYRDLSSELYYCWRSTFYKPVTIDNTSALSEDIVSEYKLLLVPHRSIKLYYGYSILVRQHALSEAAHAYWLSMQKNSETLGSLYDPLPIQATGNIHSATDAQETVLGYFYATVTTEKRVFFTRQQLTGPQGRYDSSGYEDCAAEFVPLALLQSRLPSLLIIEDIYSLVTQELIGYSASPKECIDCTLKGGTTVKPDYWK